MSEIKESIPSEKIKKELELAIIRGEYKERVPSLLQLASMFGCSDRTGGKVLKSMADEGILVVERNKGYYIVAGAKQKLLIKHRIHCQNKMERLVREAKELEIEKELLKDVAVKCIDAVYS